jgi:hypothetical protein
LWYRFVNRSFFSLCSVFVVLCGLLVDANSLYLLAFGILSDIVVYLVERSGFEGLGQLGEAVKRTGPRAVAIVDRKAIFCIPILLYSAAFMVASGNYSTFWPSASKSILTIHMPSLGVLSLNHIYAQKLIGRGLERVGNELDLFCENVLFFSYVLVLCNSIIRKKKNNVVYTLLDCGGKARSRKSAKIGFNLCFFMVQLLYLCLNVIEFTIHDGMRSSLGYSSRFFLEYGIGMCGVTAFAIWASDAVSFVSLINKEQITGRP